MPIRHALLQLYPPDWPDVSHRIRFVRAGGRCEQCDRPHGHIVYALPDGRWYDASRDAWISGFGDWCPAPGMLELFELQLTRVVLTTAHVDHDPSHGDDANLRAWCSRCHLAHDMPHHRAQRRITLRSRWALGDLFDGPYGLIGYPRNA